MVETGSVDQISGGSTTRRLAAILHADVAGYSRLMGIDEAGTHARLMACRQVIDERLVRHRGRVVGTAGDAVLAIFESVVEALTAAVEIQAALAERNAALPADQQLAFRIGLNLGDVIVDGDDVFGNGVNVAARIEALAEPGGIAVSAAVHDQLAGKRAGSLDVAFEDLGAHSLKNIEEPVRVFAVGTSSSGARRRRPRRRMLVPAAVLAVIVVGGLGAFLTFGPLGLVGESEVVAPADEAPAEAVAPAGKPTIAVLPFEDRSGEAAEAYFSDGVTEEVISALGRFSGLLVLSWSAVAPYKDGPAPLDDLAAQLGARYVVSGSIQRAGDRLRVNVQLSDAEGGVLLWSERFDEELADVFELQDRITRQLVAALAIRVTQAEQAQSFAKPTESLGAYDLVLHGRDLLRRLERVTNFEAREMFERAIAIDPDYADAHVERGWTYLNDIKFGWTQWPDRALAAADAEASRAIALDPQNASAHALQADVLKFKGDFAGAEREIDRAIDLNPNSAESLAIRASVAIFTGRPDVARSSMELALQIDPNPTVDSLQSLVGAYYLEGRYADAIALIDRFDDEVREEPLWHAILAASHAQLDQGDQAAAAVDRLRRTAPFFNAEAFASLLGTPEQSRHVLEGLRKAGL